MAEKGARIQMEAVCRQAYIDGKSLTAIEAEYGVSRQTLSAWKGMTKKPDEEFDEWDKARARKAAFGLRLEALLDRELTFAEEREPGAIGGASLDNLTKLGSLVVRFREVEGRKGKIDVPPAEGKAATKKEGLTEQKAAEIRSKILGV